MAKKITKAAGFSYLEEPDRLPSDADQIAMTAQTKAALGALRGGQIDPEPEGPMTLADVHAILADTYPGYSPIDPRGSADGLLFTLPNSQTIIVERKRVKAAANMEELRAYVESLT